MKIISLFLILTSLILPNSTLILDTNIKNLYNYKELISKLERLDQNVEYAHFNTNISYNAFDTIFFIASSTFLQSQPSPITRSCIQELRRFLKKKNKTLAIVIEPASPRKIKLFLTRLKINFNPLLLSLKAPTYNTALFYSPNEEITSFLPAGYLIKKNKNQIFITTTSKFLFNEISENFRTAPLSPELKYMANQTLTNSLEKIFNKKINALDSLKTICEEKKEKTIAAWMDLKCWDNQELDKLIALLEQTKIDLLWVRFNPERYLSKNGIEQNKKEQFFNSIKNLTQALSQLKKPPKLYIGCELTSNFKNIKPTNSVKDIFGQTYPNIPSPFDFENFWQTELIEPIKELFSALLLIGNNIPIEGIFLDLEMYHAQQQLSDYSSTTIPQNVFITKQNLEEQINLLKKEAFSLGCKIHTELNAIQNGLKVAVYMQTLPSNWFYEQLLSGLSCKEPITLATFNVEYQKHKNLLKSLKINAQHLAVLMLSKFKDNSKPDIKSLLDEHDGIWINRFNRLIEPFEENKWWSLESSNTLENVPSLITDSTHK